MIDDNINEDGINIEGILYKSLNETSDEYEEDNEDEDENDLTEELKNKKKILKILKKNKHNISLFTITLLIYGSYIYSDTFNKNNKIEINRTVKNKQTFKEFSNTYSSRITNDIEPLFIRCLYGYQKTNGPSIITTSKENYPINNNNCSKNILNDTIKILGEKYEDLVKIIFDQTYLSENNYFYTLTDISMVHEKELVDDTKIHIDNLNLNKQSDTYFLQDLLYRLHTNKEMVHEKELVDDTKTHIDNLNLNQQSDTYFLQDLLYVLYTNKEITACKKIITHFNQLNLKIYVFCYTFHDNIFNDEKIKQLAEDTTIKDVYMLLIDNQLKNYIKNPQQNIEQTM